MLGFRWTTTSLNCVNVVFVKVIFRLLENCSQIRLRDSGVEGGERTQHRRGDKSGRDRVRQNKGRSGGRTTEKSKQKVRPPRNPIRADRDESEQPIMLDGKSAATESLFDNNRWRVQRNSGNPPKSAREQTKSAQNYSLLHSFAESLRQRARTKEFDAFPE